MDFDGLWLPAAAITLLKKKKKEVNIAIIG